MTIEYLQNYWWLLISVLGAVLVFMLFVQGGQSILLETRTKLQRDLIVSSIGRKWELTFTTLVVFGGAFFASFPLFYSTSFGGAYWLWVLLLFSFIFQAVSYEFRSRPGNLFGPRVYDIFLYINGLAGCVLLGVAVSMFFFGAEFTVTKGNLLDIGAPVISQWVPTHGMEAIFSWRNLVLGIAVFFLARTMAALYLLNNVREEADFFAQMRGKVILNGVLFLAFFLWFLAMLLTANGVEYKEVAGGITSFETVPYKYLHNYLELWWAAAALLMGVVLVLYGLYSAIFTKNEKTIRRAIWFAGPGVFLVVCSLFWVSGYNNTAYYPSILDVTSSLSIRNSSSSEFTLTVMSWVSVIVPFVLAYIIYAWWNMDRKHTTPEEVEEYGH